LNIIGGSGIYQKEFEKMKPPKMQKRL